eukprot:4453839-Amphidinium_carterae.1
MGIPSANSFVSSPVSQGFHSRMPLTPRRYPQPLGAELRNIGLQSHSSYGADVKPSGSRYIVRQRTQPTPPVARMTPYPGWAQALAPPVGSQVVPAVRTASPQS